MAFTNMKIRISKYDLINFTAAMKQVRYLLILLILSFPFRLYSLPNLELVSQNSSHVKANSSCVNALLSGNGQKVLFSSWADNLDAGDVSIVQDPFDHDFFVRDLVTKTTRGLFFSENGTKLKTYDWSSVGILSTDGNFVFVSINTSGMNLAPAWKLLPVKIDLVNSTYSFFLRDLNGEFAEGDPVSISADGRFLLLSSLNDNLVLNDTNDNFDLFLYDFLTNNIQRVNVSSAGIESNASALNAAMTPDARYVVFSSGATNLVPGAGPWVNIYLRDLLFNATDLISKSAGGGGTNGNSHDPVISSDGRFIAFSSEAQNLITNGTTTSSIYLFDRALHKVIPIPRTADDEPIANVRYPQMSKDAKFIAFSGYSSKVKPDNSPTSEVFVYSLEANKTFRLDATSLGALPNDFSRSPSISADGSKVVFESAASNLLPQDIDADNDIYLVNVSSVISNDGGNQNNSPNNTPFPNQALNEAVNRLLKASKSDLAKRRFRASNFKSLQRKFKTLNTLSATSNLGISHRSTLQKIGAILQNGAKGRISTSAAPRRLKNLIRLIETLRVV